MIETFIGFFIVAGALTTLGWVSLFVASVLFITCLENNSIVVPVIITAIAAILFWPTMMEMGVRAVVIYSLVYLAIGIGWSVIKWYLFVKGKVRYYHKNYGNKIFLMFFLIK